ncbi:Chemotaxis protein methyltransferase CheR (EC 2.1.1.80), partial [Pseudomonas sp. FEN]
ERHQARGSRIHPVPGLALRCVGHQPVAREKGPGCRASVQAPQVPRVGELWCLFQTDHGQGEHWRAAGGPRPVDHQRDVLLPRTQAFRLSASTGVTPRGARQDLPGLERGQFVGRRALQPGHDPGRGLGQHTLGGRRLGYQHPGTGQGPQRALPDGAGEQPATRFVESLLPQGHWPAGRHFSDRQGPAPAGELHPGQPERQPAAIGRVRNHFPAQRDDLLRSGDQAQSGQPSHAVSPARRLLHHQPLGKPARRQRRVQAGGSFHLSKAM